MTKNIFDLNDKEAEKFFYKNQSYYEADLPKYFNFAKMLWNLKTEYLKNKDNINLEAAKNFEQVNYEIYVNKDGRYAWRKLQLLNPLLYIDLITYITQKDNWDFIKARVKKLKDDCHGKIISTSIPVVEFGNKRYLKSNQILEWWQEFEQNSFRSAIDFLYVFTTDITDCYPSIYTHTISWALHNKCVAQKDKNSNTLGNEIDKRLQGMQNGQTTGIPQGSIVMHVLAEILLTYADRKIYSSLKKFGNLEYKIIRYRDDYKVFVNSKEDGEIIIKTITEVLLKLNLKLNSAKTQFFDDIILGTIKKDKYRAFQYIKKFSIDYLQKKLILIHSFLEEHPNSKQMAKLLLNVNDEILKKINANPPKLTPSAAEVLIGIAAQITYKNPSLHTNFCLILSSLLTIFEEERALEILKSIFKKFSSISHNALLNIFLQRLAIPYRLNYVLKDKICELVEKSVNVNTNQTELWNFSWLEAPVEFKNYLANQKFISSSILNNLKKTIERSEIDIFSMRNYR